MKDEPPRDPGELSLREAWHLASRLKLKAWVGLAGAAVTVLAVTFTVGRWWEFGDRDSKQIYESPSAAAVPPGGARDKSILPAEARVVVDRRESRARHGVSRLEPTLNELPWDAVPPKRFGFVTTASGDEVRKTRTFWGYDDDARNAHWLEIHKLAKDEYVALGYLSQADSRELSLARTPSVVHLYTVPNDEAPVFVENVGLERFRLVNNRTVGDHQGQVFDLAPLPVVPSNKALQTDGASRRR
jgi:hypothetical protein